MPKLSARRWKPSGLKKAAAWRTGHEATWSVIVCSIDAGKFAQISQCYERLLAERRFEIIAIHDAKSLSEGYNRGIAAAQGDIVVFSHDDILILDTEFAAKVERRLDGDFDLLGFAGGTQLEDGYWWAAGPEYMRGAVAHAVAKDRHLSLHVYGATGANVEPVVMLDGLCLIANRKTVETVAFDAETFDGFHHYDVDFSWSAHCRGLRLGAMTDVPVIHMSGGIFGSDWKHYRARFWDKYADILPSPRPSPMPEPRATEARTAMFESPYSLLQAWRPEYLRRATIAMLRLRHE
ncbi:glycosyltransferase [Methylogaea oryzae]|uniref:glycosyltransferase n=1 Tax=Methylogaea oryzae TaxID=1295382 RepID=UPI00138F0585|nr:glycosyltransferase [Methylogaea oryzae]